MSFVKYEQKGTTGILTLSRPEALNALNQQLLKELEQQIQSISEAKQIRCLILTGEGEKAFVAGADIKEIHALGKDEALSFSRYGQKVFALLEELYCPTIAAVNGFALGGGLELALSCDFIYCNDKAKLGLPESTLGLIPGFGGTVRLARRIGPALAKEWSFGGGMVKSEEALRVGLVNKVCAPEELMASCEKTAELFAQRSPQALNNIKQAVERTYGVATKEAMEIEAQLFADVFETENQKEGTSAFIEKRPAQFKGF